MATLNMDRQGNLLIGSNKRPAGSMEMTRMTYDALPAAQKRRHKDKSYHVLCRTSNGSKWVPVYWRR